MSVMVTGGAGFIGAGLVRKLSETDEEEIVVFQRNPAKKNLEDLAGRVSLVPGDLGIFSHVLETVKNYRPRIIYHMGTMVTVPSEADPPGSFQTNVAGTFHILEAARLFDVEQVLFASSIGTYGLETQKKVVDDHTIQRPTSMYGVGKVFGEGLGRYYRSRHGLDFRCLRYPGVFGPGFGNPSLARVFSRIVEESVMGRPYTLRVAPDVRHALLYYKDAALAMIKLAEAPKANVKMICYLINGIQPALSAQEIVDMVRARIPESQLTFDPDPQLTQKYYHMPTFDDHCAREEWDWKPEYDRDRAMDDFISELRQHPERYA
jgi:threonine 3-dehydrogenase